MYQSIMIVGNVGKAPRYRVLSSGRAVADFSVAVNKKFKNGDGVQVERTTWFTVTCWGKLAELVDQYVTVGRQVLVVGEMEAAEAWLDKNGEARGGLKLTADTVKFLGSRGPAGGDELAAFGQQLATGDAEEIPF